MIGDVLGVDGRSIITRVCTRCNESKARFHFADVHNTLRKYCNGCRKRVNGHESERAAVWVERKKRLKSNRFTTLIEASMMPDLELKLTRHMPENEGKRWVI